MMLRSVASLLSPAGPRARLSILTFHRVMGEPDPLLPAEPDIRRFNEILSWLGKWFQVLPLDEAVARLQAGSLPARAAVITFDDGYANNALHALPVLQQHGMCATFFIATGFLDGGRMWNDTVIEAVRGCQQNTLDLRDAGLGFHALGQMAERRRVIDALLDRIKYLEPTARAVAVEQVCERAGARLSDALMMRSEQVLQLHRAGMQIGAHTRSHPILASLADAEAGREIADSKATLEGLLGEAVTLFAYPNGKPGRDYQAKHAAMVRAAGFSAAVSTAAGTASQASDPMQLPRFTPWDRSQLRYGIRLVRNLRAPEAQRA